MIKKDFFKIGLLVSVGIHFSLFIFSPMWKPATLPEPELMEVTLIVVEPPPPAVVKKTPVASPTPSPPPAPPPEIKAEQKLPPELSPVEVAVTVSQALPVIPPHAQVESKIEVHFPTLSFEPIALSRTESTISREKQEDKKLLYGSPIFAKSLPDIPSPLRGEAPSLVRSPGTGEQVDLMPGTEGLIGITFRGLGVRKVTYKPEFAYPEEMQQQGKGGRGVVEVDVTPDGNVVDVRIIASAGHPQLDAEIRRNAHHYKFSSADEPGIKTYPGEFNFRF